MIFNNMSSIFKRLWRFHPNIFKSYTSCSYRHSSYVAHKKLKAEDLLMRNVPQDRRSSLFYQIKYKTRYSPAKTAITDERRKLSKP